MELICKKCGKAFSGREGKKYCSQECYRDFKEQDIVGEKFGNLKVIGKSTTRKQHRECICVCGKHIERSKHSLTTGGSNQSCGCMAKGGLHMSGTKFYHKYNTMKLRCESPQANNYKLYGGRGIKCERKTFQEFYKDMYNSYYEHCQLYGEENTTIERIDVNGNYCKSNCKRATLKEQANNKRNNRMLTYKGITQSLEMWSKTLGITYRTLYHRLRRGVPFEFIAQHPNERHYNK